MTYNILRLTQSLPSQGKINIHIEFITEGKFTLSANVSFEFNLYPQDQERLRWYFEDYLQYFQDPAPTIANQVEQSLKEIGIELFDKIFNSNIDARNIWSNVRPKLNDTRIEIASDIQEATNIPWELMRSPDDLQPLALSVASFMRINNREHSHPRYEKTSEGPIRILLAICRPDAEDDVPFRSVASRIIKSLSAKGSSRFQLDVLRPPTFANLGYILKAARDQNKPYHVLHFDGHGAYVGNRGWIYFEHPDLDEEPELVSGERLGKLMQESDVPMLVLNACRSAYFESPSEPSSSQDANVIDARLRVRAFGSLAQEVMHSGLAAVVAMRYVVYAVTAAQFMAEFYDALVQGKTFDEAANLGRKYLHDQPAREIAFREMKLQDWSVPILFGAGSIALFSSRNEEEKFENKISKNDAMPDWNYIDPSLPHGTDTGFFGRDETLLAIDRALDSHKVVLLHAYAGNGKTATAAEFARWYSETRGVDGPVLFTSFERHKSLPQVLDKIGQVFSRILKVQDINWLTLNQDQKRSTASEILKQQQVLWIWDNVEPVAGFPRGTESSWSIQEQHDLANFLRDAQETKAKFLLTSRREEDDWLGDLPYRVKVRPMPMFERMEMARAIADKHGQSMVDANSWRPLLRYTEGNPLTITVLMCQVLREGIITEDQIKKFVDQLISGEKDIKDDERLGRSRSLGASLSYGFQYAFNDFERKILAILHFFQGFVNIDVLASIFDTKKSVHIDPEGRFSRIDGIVILNKAVDTGLLTNVGEGRYSIHPALPWYFNNMFQQYYKKNEAGAVRAFVTATSALANILYNEYVGGNREVVSDLILEENNFLFAGRLGLNHNLWMPTIYIIQGIRVLYEHTGRRFEWKRLVEQIEPYYLDARTFGPIPGRQNGWDVVINSKIRLAHQERKFEMAQKLIKKYIELSRRHVARYLAESPGSLDRIGKAVIWNYIVSIEEVGHIQREMKNPECLQTYQEALKIRRRFGFKDKTGSLSQCIGTAYLQVDGIKDLSKAEKWCKDSLNLIDSSDSVSLGKSLLLLGQISLEHIRELKECDPEQKSFKEAQEYLNQALETFPSDDIRDLMQTHNSLGNLYGFKGDCNKGLKHYREAIMYADDIDEYSSALYRLNVAYNLFDAKMISDAKDYARSALKKFEAYGLAGAKRLHEAENLINEIEDP